MWLTVEFLGRIVLEEHTEFSSWVWLVSDALRKSPRPRWLTLIGQEHPGEGRHPDQEVEHCAAVGVVGAVVVGLHGGQGVVLTGSLAVLFLQVLKGTGRPETSGQRAPGKAGKASPVSSSVLPAARDTILRGGPLAVLGPRRLECLGPGPRGASARQRLYPFCTFPQRRRLGAPGVQAASEPSCCHHQTRRCHNVTTGSGHALCPLEAPSSSATAQKCKTAT